MSGLTVGTPAKRENTTGVDKSNMKRRVDNEPAQYKFETEPRGSSSEPEAVRRSLEETGHIDPREYVQDPRQPTFLRLPPSALATPPF
jgi:hypothetical protein